MAMPMYSMNGRLVYPTIQPQASVPGTREAIAPQQWPYFKDNLLVFPRAGVALQAQPSGTGGNQGNIDDISETLLSLTSDMEKLQSEILLQELKKVSQKELKKEQQEKRELQTKWFMLPENTYGAAIWAILVLEPKAADVWLLWPSANAPWVPVAQRWTPANGCWGFMKGIHKYFTLRFFPFLRSLFFQLTAVFLTGVSWLLQFGFTYWLDTKIGPRDFFDDDNAPYVCSTSGWVQLISVGFFLVFMLGQIPNLIKNVMLILTSEKETDENRGEDGARSLWIDWEPDGDDEDDVPEKKKKKQLLHSQLIREAFMVDATMEGLLPERRKKALFRSRWNHAVRQCFSLSFPLAEGSVTGYLLYVGVKYIFWSGFSSLEQADRADFPGHTPDEGVFPWMSNTTGVEELLLATVALQFIVDIDEAVFKLVLPKSVQAAVAGCKLHCQGWLPTTFSMSDFTGIGKHDMNTSFTTAFRRLAERCRSGSRPIKSGEEVTAERMIKLINSAKQDAVREKAMKENTVTPGPGEEDSGMDDYIFAALLGYFRLNKLRKMCDAREKKDEQRQNTGNFGYHDDGGQQPDGQRQASVFRNPDCFWKLYCRAAKDYVLLARICREALSDLPTEEVKQEAYAEVFSSFQEAWKRWGRDRDRDRDPTITKADPISFMGTMSALWVSPQHEFWAACKQNDTFKTVADEDIQGLLDDVWKDTDNQMKVLLHDVENYEKYTKNQMKSQKQQNPKGRFVKRVLEELFFSVDVSEKTSVRQVWLNLLPDATFLLSFMLLALPVLLVLFTRARMGCIEFKGVPLDDIPFLELKNTTEVFEDYPGQITVPFIASSIIFLVFLVSLLMHALNAWFMDVDAAKNDTANNVFTKTNERNPTDGDDLPKATSSHQRGSPAGSTRLSSRE